VNANPKRRPQFFTHRHMLAVTTEARITAMALEKLCRKLMPADPMQLYHLCRQEAEDEILRGGRKQ